MSDPSTPAHDSHASGSHYQPSIGVVLIIVILFVGATVFMIRAVSPSSSTPTTTTTSSTTNTTPTVLPRIVKSKVRVQVANGTDISDLAGHYTQVLMTQDWDTLPPGNASAVSQTILYYHKGFKAAALEIAGIIKVSDSVVHPLAGKSPVQGAAGDDVIVILGPNSRVK